MKIWVFLSLLLLTLGVQFTLPQILPLFRYVDLPLILVVWATRRATPRRALWQGLAVGLAQDMTLSPIYPIGAQALSKMTVGLITQGSTRVFNTDHPAVQFLLVFGLASLNNWLIVGLFAAFGQPLPLPPDWRLVTAAAATALLNLPIWLANERARQLERE